MSDLPEIPSILREDIITMLFGCLVYRLGGQQSFSPEEIDEIKETIEGVRITVDSNDRIVLTAKPKSST
jgi:hypothetical protein